MAGRADGSVQVLRWLVPVAFVALFLLAAKSHGRQLRIERELAGYLHVTFGGENSDFVDALWRHDRIRFWILAPVTAVGLFVVWWRRGPRHLAELAGYVLVAAPVTAFIALGIASLLRFLAAAPATQRDAAWVAAALRGSVAWWLPTVALAVTLAMHAARRG